MTYLRPNRHMLPSILAFALVMAPQQLGVSAQQPAGPKQSSLVLADVFSQEAKSGLPIRDFTKEDFRLFNDRKEVPITSFESGARFQTRPVVIWLTVLCNEGGKGAGSREFSGKEALFRPALDSLDKRDTVAVAHWCDNGDVAIDLPPTTDRDAAIRSLTEALRPIPFNVGANSNLTGEEAFRKAMELILRNAQHMNPRPLPVIVFLYGGRGAQPHRLLDELVDRVLQSSGIAFGIRDEKDAKETSAAAAGEQGYFTQYIIENTGGQLLTATPNRYGDALSLILAQLHFRYQLGFVPPAIDGRRHEIKVELTERAREKHPGTRIRYRSEYIPARELPDWAR